MEREDTMSMAFSRRQLLFGGGGLVSTIFLAACGQATPTAAPAKPTEPAKPAETKPADKPAAAPTLAPMSVQGKGQVTLLWQMSAGDAWMKGSVAALPTLLEKVPSIGEVKVQPTPDDWQNKLVAAMVAGTAPDVFDMWGDIMPPFVERNQVVDVEPLVKKDYTTEDLKDFYDWQWRDFVMPWLNNIRFGMPRYVNIMFLWYRKDLFDQAGVKYPTNDWTHDDYADAARKLTVKDSAGKIKQYGLAFPAWNWDRYWYKPVIWGGHTVDPTDNTKAVFDSEQALSSLEWSRKLMWDDKVMLQPLDIQMGAFRLFFPTGIMAMAEDGIYPFEMDDVVQGKFPWAYAHTPKGPNGQRKVLGTTDGAALWKGTKNLEQAWALTKWIAGPENQLAAVVKAAGRVPVRHSVLKQWKDIVPQTRPNLKDVNVNVAIEAMEMGYPSGREFFKDNISAADLIRPALEKVYITGGTPVTYMKEVAQQVTTAQKKGSR
jgi:multiple sugar transport system substrate-binding protein